MINTDLFQEHEPDILEKNTHCRVLMIIVTGRLTDHIMVSVHTLGEAFALNDIRIVSKGMPTLNLTGGSRMVGAMAMLFFATQFRPYPAHRCWRYGGVVASSLARMIGRQGLLGIVDPDVLCSPKMLVWNDPNTHDYASQLGVMKAMVLTDRIRALPDGPQVEVRYGSTLVRPYELCSSKLH